jgi:hypothetical protein
MKCQTFWFFLKNTHNLRSFSGENTLKHASILAMVYNLSYEWIMFVKHCPISLQNAAVFENESLPRKSFHL